MAKNIFLFILLLLAAHVNGQTSFNYKELGVGFDANYIKGYTNVNRQDSHPAFDASIIYNYNPYLPIAAEIQMGELSGGGLKPSQDKYGRVYDNHYKALMIHLDLQLGGVINYEDNFFANVVKHLYAGTGFGVISNSITAQRYSIYAPPYPQPGYYQFPGSDSNIGFVIPLRFGYEIKIFDEYNEPAYGINIGYIHNVVLGEGLDGYNDPSAKFKNNSPDQYRQIVVGFRYYFGNVVAYNKEIRKSKIRF